jgi:ubiquinone/menaquinone biosynthesis C-methylase UbiE
VDAPNPAAWEAAYLAFETPEEETRKFVRRLRSVGADRWDRGSQVVELFAGRGSGLLAWQHLGFTSSSGLDLSPTLARRFRGNAGYVVADARRLPFADASRDVVSIQGGLHHLPAREDLRQVLAEARRVLRPGGRLLAVEPWLDSFLRFVHWTSARSIARRLSPRVDALQAMIELEGATYAGWLDAPEEILGLLKSHFEPEILRVRWGKLVFLGRPRKAS